MLNLKTIGLIGFALSTAACSMERDNPGGTSGTLPAINIEGHDLNVAVAHAWQKTCLDGVPSDTSTMMGLFEHNIGDEYLTSHGVMMTVAEGDCSALLDAATTLGGAGIVADGLRDSGDTTNVGVNNEVNVVSTAIVN